MDSLNKILNGQLMREYELETHDSYVNCVDNNEIKDFYLRYIEHLSNKLNQLKTEISQIAKDMETDSKKVCGIEIDYYIRRLLKLSE